MNYSALSKKTSRKTFSYISEIFNFQKKNTALIKNGIHPFSSIGQTGTLYKTQFNVV